MRTNARNSTKCPSSGIVAKVSSIQIDIAILGNFSAMNLRLNGSLKSRAM
jgi:hypothetical protein